MVVNDYFYLHHLLGEWSKMLLTTIHYEGEILRLPSARLLIAYRERNVVEMKKNGRVILLSVEPETVLTRLEDDHSRPLLENNKNVDFVRALMEKRRDKYEAAADIIVRTDHRSVQEICEEILAKLRAMDGESE